MYYGRNDTEAFSVEKGQFRLIDASIVEYVAMRLQSIPDYRFSDPYFETARDLMLAGF